MTDERTPRTVSISFGERGQTTQDFVVGIGIFLLATAFVFSYVPTLLTPFTSSFDGGEAAKADRIAATIVDDLSEDPDRPNHLNGSAFEDRYVDANSTVLAGELGLRSTDVLAIDRVNVSLEPLNQSSDAPPIAGGGDRYDGRAAGSSARIVTIDFGDVEGGDALDGKESDCEPACRLVVRVW